MTKLLTLSDIKRKTMTKQSCRTCALWDIERAKTPGGRVMKNTVSPCLWVIPKIDLPSSVRSYLPSGQMPTAGWCSSDEGDGCPCYVKRGPA